MNKDNVVSEDLFIKEISNKLFVKKFQKTKKYDFRLLFPKLVENNRPYFSGTKNIVRSIFYPFCGKFKGTLVKCSPENFSVKSMQFSGSSVESIKASGVSSDFVCEYMLGYDSLRSLYVFWSLFLYRYNLTDEYQTINKKYWTITRDLENMLQSYDGLSVKDHKTQDYAILTKGKDYDDFCIKLITIMQHCHLLEVLGNYYNFKLDDVEWSSW